MAFSQQAPRKLSFGAGRPQTPVGVQMQRTMRTGMRPVPRRQARMNDDALADDSADALTAPAPSAATPNSGGSMTTSGMTRIVPPSAPSDPTQNSGGTISYNGETRDVAPSLRTGLTPTRPNQGGMMSQPLGPGVSAKMPIAASPAGGAPPATGFGPTAPTPGQGSGHAIHINIGSPNGGTGATPLSGDTAGAGPTAAPTQPAGAPPAPASANAAPQAPQAAPPANAAAPAKPQAPAKPRSAPIPNAPPTPASSLGFSQRGGAVPKGQDATGGGHTGGSGLYSRSFQSSGAASLYDGFVKKLFRGRTA